MVRDEQEVCSSSHTESQDKDSSNLVGGETSLGAARTARVLECVAGGRWTLSALSRELGVQRRTLGRVVASLEGAGLVCRDNGGQIAPGRRLVALSRQLAREFDPVILAREAVDELVRLTRCTAMLHQAHGDHLLPEVIGTPEDAVAVSFPPGRSIELWQGVGRAVLAHRPAADVRRLATRSPRPDFLAVLESERGKELFISRGEVVPGITALASPVFEPDGQVIGALSIVGFDPELPERYGELVRGSARRLSQMIATTEDDARR